MKVTDWTNWDNNKYLFIEDMTDEEFEEATKAVIQEIKEKGYKFSGNSHQYTEGCCPILNNKYVYCVSMRSWGAIMAKVLELPEDDGYAYCQWAWYPPEDENEIFPKLNRGNEK